MAIVKFDAEHSFMIFMIIGRTTSLSFMISYQGNCGLNGLPI
jgi:hypothetical protein